MDNYQDWKPVVFNKVSKDAKEKQRITNAQKTSQKPKKYNNVLKPPNNLGKQIAAARCSKNITRIQLANQLQIAHQVLAKWEAQQEIPTNQQIAKIEKCIGVKLSRCVKIEIDDE
tara:strand:+ start:115 stop:459 length:345 start_codon:yes stop_codon:yes gene_type:complete